MRKICKERTGELGSWKNACYERICRKKPVYCETCEIASYCGVFS